MNRHNKKMDFRTRAELHVARLIKSVSRRLAAPLPACTQPPVRVVEAGSMGAIADKRVVEPIPKILWAYWHTQELPPLIAKCVQGWQRLHPDWKILVLNEETAREYVSHWPTAELERATIHQRADWLRLMLLHEHGGIWLDASTILTRPLDWVLQAQQEQKTECLGLYMDALTRDARYPVVEIGLLAAPAGSRFIAAVLDEFTQQVIKGSAQAYVDHLKQLGIFEEVCQNIDTPLYLTVHLAIQRVMQSGDAYRLGVWRAEDTGYTYHVQAGWNRARFKLRMLFMHAGVDVAPLIKLRGPDRRKLDHYLAQGLYLPESIAGQYLVGAEP